MYRGLYFYLNFALIHRLWVPIKAASMRRFLCVPTINVLSKNTKKIIIFHLKIIIFVAMKYCCILRGRVIVMLRNTSFKLFFWGGVDALRPR